MPPPRRRPGKGNHWLFVEFLLILWPTTAVPFHTGATETQVEKAQHLGVIIGCCKNLAWTISGWLHVDLLLVGCVMIGSQWTSQSFCCWTPAPCTRQLSGRNECVPPQNWLTGGYFPNDSGCSCPEMNDLLYFKWQADCFHSTLTPGSAALTLFSGSGASVIKRGGGNRRCRFSLGLREAERNACFPAGQSHGWSLIRVRPAEVSAQLSAPDFLQPAQSLVRNGCWWAGFPTFRLSVGRFVTHKHDSSINLLT